MPVSRKRSRRSRRRQGCRFRKYSLEPLRNVRRAMEISVYSTGSTPRLFTIVSETSARPSGFRCAEPVKITSSSVSPRRWRMFCSPSTQRMASTMFVLPLPLGPTTEVMPGPKSTRTRCGNDLKPWMSSRFRNTGLPLQVGECLGAIDDVLLEQAARLRRGLIVGGEMSDEDTVPAGEVGRGLVPRVEAPGDEVPGDGLHLGL